MPYYRDPQAVGSQFNTLQDFTPTGGQSFAASVAETFGANPTVLGFDALEVARANRNGERLSAYDAGKLATDAGLRDFAPGEGEYTREALDIVIERKRQQRQREDVIGRTPWSLTGTPIRAAGMLGATLLDPLNVGAAFVPVVREARYSALLRAAGGGLERAAIRAGVGAVEGTVGMAALEPLIYGAHQYLDDDYTMRDSLLNIAFGGLLGGGLHVVGGRVADALMPGRWVSARTIDDAVGNPDLPGVRTDRGSPEVGSAADIAARSTPEARYDGLRTAVAQLADGRTIEVGPIFAERAAIEGLSFTPAEARVAAVERLRDELRAELLPEVAQQAERGAIAPLKAEREQAALALDRIGRDYRERVKELQDREGLKRKQAEDRVTKADEDARASAQQKLDRLDQQLEANAAGNRAAQDMAALERGDVPARFEERVAAEAGRIMTSGQRRRLADAIGGIYPSQPGVRVLAAGEATPDAMRAAARRQAAPESSITGDVQASRAADERLAAAPKNEDVAAAQAGADNAAERLAAARADMEARGASPAALKAYDEAAKEADAMVADAEALGRAVEAAASCAAREV